MPNLKDGEWGQDFFSSCTGLKELTLPQLTVPDITYTNSKGNSENCTIVGMIGNSDDIEDIDLRLLVVDIPEWGALQEKENLKRANFASATSVGNGAFYGCTALETVDLSSVESVGANAFQDCSNLTAIELPLAISVGAYALNGCSSLETLILTKYPGSSNGVIGGDAGTSIGGWGSLTGQGYFYENFPNLIYVDFASVVTVNAGAFYDHSAIEAIDFRSATSVGKNAFDGCISLKRLNLSSLTDSGNIGSWAFSGINDDQCEIWLSSEQAETAVDTTWQGVAWKAIHSVDSDGTCETPFVLKSEN